jgi:hypothetical protein
MQPLPHHPEGNGTRPISPLPRPATPAAGPPQPPAGGVSRLDRVTLQLGVAVAVVIAVCSNAVSATSLYALGLQAGYSWWQAAAVPVVADGPAIYGMFRIVSRSRRGATGVGYGWLLVIAGTLASIGGNVAHAKDDLVARAIAAAIPLAVLAMLEGLKGDAGEVTRLTTQAPAGDGPAELLQADQRTHAANRRNGRTATPDPDARAVGAQRTLPAGPRTADTTRLGPGCRRPMPNRARTARPGPPAPWLKPLAVAAAAPPASCNTSVRQLRRRRREPAQFGLARCRAWLCLPGHPGPAPAPSPPPPRPSGPERQPTAAAPGISRVGLLVSGSGLCPGWQAPARRPGAPRGQGRHL